MKTIGLIGGMSWESSLEYYRIINEQVKKNLGGSHSAKSLMYSVDFEEIKLLQHEGKWDKATQIMVDAAKKLEKGGADFVVICTNTMHKMADQMQSQIQIPILHIVDATAEKIRAKAIKKIGLLGTKFTMEEDFYRARLENKFGLKVVIPNSPDRQIIHDVIYNELVLGILKQDSREQYIRIINQLVHNGAEGVILGCTEIPLLVHQKDVDVLLFDTTRIHAEAAVNLALFG